MDSYRVDLIVGDWSGDGHEKTDKYSFNSNKPGEEVEAAYNLATSKLGIDLYKECADYEQDEYSSVFINTLIDKGVVSENDREELSESQDTSSFANMYIRIAKFGDPELRISLIEDAHSINIGGYGLFWC